MRRRARINVSGRGFTLIELLVALAIFAVLSVMAYGGLEVILNSKERVERQTRRLGELQMLFTIMERDIEQAVDRPVRDGFGDPLGAMLGSETRLELTRAGWPNPAGGKRSHLQRIAYSLDGESLKRASWAVLDRTQASSARTSTVMEGVSGFEARFLDANEQWQPYWPQPVAAGAPAAPALARAVEVTVELEDWGRITRLFRVAGARSTGAGADT